MAINITDITDDTMSQNETQQAQLSLREYLQAICNGQVPIGQPPSFDDNPEIREIVEKIKNYANQGKSKLVQRCIDQSKKDVPAFAAIYDQDVPKVEITKSETLVPPLPPGVALPPVHCPQKEAYIRYSRLVSPEGFEEFHSSCYWGMLSMVAGRRVAIDFAKIQYTPLMVVLAARTSAYKKTSTGAAARDVLKGAGLDWLLGLTKTTPSKLLSDMAGTLPREFSELSIEAQERLTRRLSMSGQRGWIYNEFGKLIKAMNKPTGPMTDFAELLLQFDDCEDVLDTGTQARGTESIEKPYLALIGTMTPTSVRSQLGAGSEMWGDGFMARFVFSCPPPDTDKDEPIGRGYVPIPAGLTKNINAWHQRLIVPEVNIDPILDDKNNPTGRYQKIWVTSLTETLYKVSDEAYTAWIRYRSALKQIAKKLETEDFDGSYDRLPIMALRVAALGASFEGARQIEFRHWQMGQEQAELWRSSLHQLYAQVNMTAKYTGPTLDDRIIEVIKKLTEKDPNKKGPTATEISRYLHMDVKKVESNLMILTRLKVLKKEAGRQSPRYTAIDETTVDEMTSSINDNQTENEEEEIAVEAF